ncbi:ArgP/LysG family DNA-binding transcriptional regulator [Serinibacter salmoneus]|uniref:LysR family transcriptional regulator n=1 Tax=Serinibacter salmoneus TaxID=556530 RepID=A0A2A9CXT8_9MICO|nr:ArgP/LysG family DNA-binding transcriptional regulator [Serinibacter salmoneus]PFG18482.1 LysR family transcriptional regulator [Serinibacter salmoneus]
MEWDLAQLRTFAEVVERGSLEAAAASLHLTPSAVSQRIRALEHAVGAVLLQRRRPVRATPAGERVLLLARQMTALAREADADLSGPGAELPVVRIGVNADSLATWVLPALAPLAPRMRLELVRGDQDTTAALLREGAVMAAITSEARAVQGCRAEVLGAMRYLPVAAPSLLARGFADLGSLPVVVYDGDDRLQDEALAAAGVASLTPPRHYVPASTQYAEAVRMGLGWGMVPQVQLADWPPGAVEPVRGLDGVDVVLHWQQWRTAPAALEEAAQALRAAAARALRPL